MPCNVICVSHAEGAGGPEVGRLLAERTGLRYVDDGIILAAAHAKGLYPEAVSLAESHRAGRTLEVDFHRFERTENVRTLIREAIAATADEGSVVIVAHAASYALAARTDVLRVFVTASTEARVERVATAEGHDIKTAARTVAASDKARASYLKDFYAVHHELPTHYDLVLNTDRVALETAAEAIAQVAELRGAELNPVSGAA